MREKSDMGLEIERHPFDKPGWVGREVTGESRYYNSNLIRHSYSRWAADSRGKNL